jgi:hypothetical protein
MSFWQGSIGGKEVVEAQFSQKIHHFFGARQERVNLNLTLIPTFPLE